MKPPKAEENFEAIETLLNNEKFFDELSEWEITFLEDIGEKTGDILQTRNRTNWIRFGKG